MKKIKKQDINLHVLCERILAIKKNRFPSNRLKQLRDFYSLIEECYQYEKENQPGILTSFLIQEYVLFFSKEEIF